MKNYFFTFIFLLICINYSLAQVTINCNTEACTNNVSPGPANLYFFTVNDPTNTPCTGYSGITACHIKWELTNGTFPSLGTSITTYEGDGSIYTVPPGIEWKNINGNAKIKVTVSPNSTCSSCPSVTKELTFPIRYLGEPGNIKINGTAYTGTYNLSCGTTPITVSADAATNATNYTWSLPSGWSYTGSGNSITVTPNAGGGGGISITASRSDVSSLSFSKYLTITRPSPAAGAVVSGDSYICSGNSTYSVTGLTGGSSVNWSSSNTSILTIDPSSGVATKVGNGSATITATITDICGTASKTKVVWCGPPHYSNGYYISDGLSYGLAEGDEFENTFCWLGNPTFGEAFTVIPGASSVTWTKLYSNPSTLSWFPPSTGNLKITFTANGQEAIFRLSFSNICGSTNKLYSFKTVTCSGFMAYPNPAEDKLTLEFDNISDISTLPESINLYSENSTILVKSISIKKAFEQKSFNENKLILDISDLPRGIYYLHYTKNNKTERKRIILK